MKPIAADEMFPEGIEGIEDVSIQPDINDQFDCLHFFLRKFLDGKFWNYARSGRF